MSRESLDGGWLEGVVGGMCSGKTEEVLRRVKRATIAGQKVLAFKPKTDVRSRGIKSRAHEKGLKAKIVRKPLEILAWVLNAPDCRVVVLDEVQFFPPGIVSICTALAEMGKRVIWSGLDTDWKGDPFGPVPNLMAVSEYVDKLHAICTEPGCGKPACRSQRMTDCTEQVEVGHEYEARCRKHHRAKRSGI